MEPINLGHLAVWNHPVVSGAPKARVLLIHGIGEHSGRHKNTCNTLTSNGYEVVRFDLRGAGRSGGRRQHIEQFTDYVDDVVHVFNWTCSQLQPLSYLPLGVPCQYRGPRKRVH